MFQNVRGSTPSNKLHFIMDYYKTLEVSKSASSEEIKKAFRKKAHQCHPDKPGGDEKKFKEINEAYQILSNPQKRNQYDQYGSTFEQAQSQGNSGFHGFSGSSDFREAFRGGSNGVEFNFEDLGDIFGDFFGNAKKQTARKTQGDDIELEMSLKFEEAVFGIKKQIEINKLIICPHCHGNATKPGTRIVICPTCNGAGQVQQVQSTIFGQFRTVGVCPDCQGEGKKALEKCNECNGQGRVRKAEKIEIEIPAGIDHGQTLKLSNQGNAGIKGGRAGNLFVTVNVQPHSRFKRKGNDILNKTIINFSQAVFGDKIEVETLEGKVRLKIPSGTISGKIFRLKDKGVPYLHSRGKGDQLVEVVINVPQKLSKEQKKLLEEFKKQGI
ncbi:molecular chaperone DnaJ [Candidatus Kuenenbacteria bacterium HGW-Kuenenbacteria-1]|uniref:Chaperone protein DnaJ n=1 Tax=Candidatus Kuenenbacteria bacterium HGW-Kuenenbacteria-1 TaxID=2013812 RepID=A0A2N1UN74_9BACT|nr:MAG: molecular chaperone DnaJ [Candidatus Kuenenbacteria bacterium HGW-Kuenenbacteria-1]